MQRHDTKSSGLDLETRGHAKAVNMRTLQLEGVNHDVADKFDAILGNTFGLQIPIAIERGRPENICQPIGDDAINLLGH